MQSCSPSPATDAQEDSVTGSGWCRTAPAAAQQTQLAVLRAPSGAVGQIPNSEHTGKLRIELFIDTAIALLWRTRGIPAHISTLSCWGDTKV